MIYVNSCGHDSHHLKPCDIEHKNGVPDYLYSAHQTGGMVGVGWAEANHFPQFPNLFSTEYLSIHLRTRYFRIQ